MAVTDLKSALAEFEKQHVNANPGLTLAELLQKKPGSEIAPGPRSIKYQFVGSHYVYNTPDLAPGGVTSAAAHGAPVSHLQPQSITAGVLDLNTKVADLIKKANAHNGASTELWYLYTNNHYDWFVTY